MSALVGTIAVLPNKQFIKAYTQESGQLMISSKLALNKDQQNSRGVILGSLVPTQNSNDLFNSTFQFCLFFF